MRKLALPVCEEMGVFLWDVKFEKEGATWFLRVFIDKDGGVDMNDCEEFSRKFDKILDDADPVSGSYVFECGSPGLGRELRRAEHFQCCIGDDIRVRTIRPDENGEREFVGKLLSYENKRFTMLSENQGEMEFELPDCSFVKLYDDGDLFN